jgi:hypothetical protein
MPNWLIKSALHRTISWLPNRQFWNGLFQTWITKSNHLEPAAFETKVAESHRHLQAFQPAHRPVTDFTVFELGTGWFPIIPIGLYLCGAREVWTVDIEPLLNPGRLNRVLQFYCDYAQRGQLKPLLPQHLPERLEKLRPLLPQALTQPPATVLAQLPVHVLVADARKTPVPPASVDFFTSSGVLEYIPRPVLQGILAEARRIAAPGAVMSHRLNLIDQYSYFDSSITAFNFLRYTERQWRWLNSPLTWQNRLRISDFRTLLTDAGFEIAREESTPGSPQALASVPLAPEFKRYTREDLLVLHSFLTARLPAPPGTK